MNTDCGQNAEHWWVWERSVQELVTKWMYECECLIISICRPCVQLLITSTCHLPQLSSPKFCCRHAQITFLLESSYWWLRQNKKHLKSEFSAKLILMTCPCSLHPSMHWRFDLENLLPVALQVLRQIFCPPTYSNIWNCSADIQKRIKNSVTFCINPTHWELNSKALMMVILMSPVMFCLGPK